MAGDAEPPEPGPPGLQGPEKRRGLRRWGGDRSGQPGGSACPESGRRQDPRGCSPPGSSVHGIFQARCPERVTISYSSDVRVRAKSLQSSLTLCNLTDHSLASFSVHGSFQARTLGWVAFSFSTYDVYVDLLSRSTILDTAQAEAIYFSLSFPHILL